MVQKAVGSIAGSSILTLSNATKRIYSTEKILAMFSRLSILWPMFNKRLMDSKTITGVGEGYYEGIQTAGNQGFGHRALETSPLPTPVSSLIEQWFVLTKNLFGKVRIYDKTSKILTGQNPKGWINARLHEIADITKEIAHHNAWLLYGDGSGTLGRYVSSTQSGTQTVITLDTNGTTHGFRLGMYVDVIDSTGSNISLGHRVDAIDRGANTVTLDRTADEGEGSEVDIDSLTTATDLLVRTGEYNNVPMGLGLFGAAGPSARQANGIIEASGTFQNINRATAGNEFWQARMLAVATDGISTTIFKSALIDKMLDEIAEAGYQESIDVVVTTPGHWRTLGNEAKVDRRFINVKIFDQGVRAMEHEGIPVIKDHMCPFGVAAGINFASMRGAWDGPRKIDWFDTAGGLFHLSPANLAAHEAVLTSYYNNACRDPQQNIKYTGLTLT